VKLFPVALSSGAIFIETDDFVNRYPAELVKQISELLADTTA